MADEEIYEGEDDDEEFPVCPRCGGTGLAWEGWDCEWCCGEGYLEI